MTNLKNLSPAQSSVMTMLNFKFQDLKKEKEIEINIQTSKIKVQTIKALEKRNIIQVRPKAKKNNSIYYVLNPNYVSTSQKVVTKKKGVIDQIVTIVATSKKPLTKIQIHDKLCKAFPERLEENLMATVQSQLSGKAKGLRIKWSGKANIVKGENKTFVMG